MPASLCALIRSPILHWARLAPASPTHPATIARCNTGYAAEGARRRGHVAQEEEQGDEGRRARAGREGAHVSRRWLVSAGAREVAPKPAELPKPMDEAARGTAAMASRVSGAAQAAVLEGSRACSTEKAGLGCSVLRRGKRKRERERTENTKQPKACAGGVKTRALRADLRAFFELEV